MSDGGLKKVGDRAVVRSQYSRMMWRKTGSWGRDMLRKLDVVCSLGAGQFGGV